jgi:hypothetical protein
LHPQTAGFFGGHPVIGAVYFNNGEFSGIKLKALFG